MPCALAVAAAVLPSPSLPPAPPPPGPAGMGLPGLLCSALGAARVLLTDYEPVVVERLAQNAALNGLAARCSTQALDWFDRSSLAPADAAAFDLLLLADVIYAAAVVEPLVATLRVLLRPGTGASGARGRGAGGWRSRSCRGGSWHPPRVAGPSPCPRHPRPAAHGPPRRPARPRPLAQARRWWRTASGGRWCLTGGKR